MSDPGLDRYCILAGKHGDTPRFAPPLLGTELVEEYPAAKDAGGSLYVYRDNAWRPNGAEFYGQQIRQRLGEEWQQRHTNETLAWIQHGEVKLDERPPLDRIRLANGVLRIGEKGGVKLEDHDVDPLTPIHLPVEFDIEAKCPRFEEFLDQALDPEVARIAQEVMGYLLLPDNSRQVAFLAHGQGGNGKTVWTMVCRELLGRENTAAHPLHALADNRFAAADLYGKLANICSDISSNELSSSALFRAITGGDPIQAEHKYQSGFSFVPYARLVFSANKYPPISNPLNALFDRWVVLPFDKRFRGTDKQDEQLTSKLTTPEELSGILNFALKGLFRLRKQGHFSSAKASDAALEDFRLAADVVAAFIRDELGKPGFYPRVRVYERFNRWADKTGHTSMSRNAFFERVRQRLGNETKNRGQYGWRIGRGKA